MQQCFLQKQDINKQTETEMARKRSTKGKKNDPANAIAGLAIGIVLIIFGTSGKQGLINVGVMALKLLAMLVLLALAVRWWRRRQATSAMQTSGSSKVTPISARIAARNSGAGPGSGTDDQSRDVYRAAGERLSASSAPVTPAGTSQAADIATSTRPSQWAREVLHQIEWKRFEELLEGLWQAKGYRAELTGRGADGGVDIRLFRPSAPDKLLGVIQCKSRASEAVGVNVARELFGVMHHEQVPLGIVAATSGFTPAAREFAAGKHLQLWDGDEVLRQIQMLDAAGQARLLAHVTRGDFRTPTCPSCDEKMVVRTPRSGNAFYGCRNFPRCRSVINSASLTR